MIKTQLPDFVIDTNSVENTMNEIELMISTANKHLQTLKNEGIPTDLNTLKSILKDEDSFKDWLNGAEQSYIGKIGFLPREEKLRIHSTFEDLRKRTDTARNSLHGFIFNKRGYEVQQLKDGTLTLNMDDIKIKVEEASKKHFTEKDKEYFSLMQDVYLAIEKVRKFERKEKYIPFSNTETFKRWLSVGFTAESLVRSWEWGKMSNEYLKMMEEDEE